MPWRRFFLWMIPFCFIILFGESFLLTVVGVSLKTYLRIQKGLELQFSSLEWRRQGLVFSNLRLNDTELFSLFAPEVLISIQAKHIKIDRPSVYLKQIPPFVSHESSRWTCQIENGWIEGVGFPGASFSFTQGPSQVGGQLHIDVGTGFLFVSTRMETGKELIDVSCDQFPLSYLNFWTGLEWEGTLQGSFCLAKKGAQLSLLTGSLVGTEIGCEKIVKGICGKVDWDGFSGLSLDSIRTLDDGHLRLNISEGTFLGEEQKEIASHFNGVLSFDGRSGAKWEMCFEYLDQKVQGTGRGFFQSLQGRWFESELCFKDSSIGLYYTEKNGGVIWDVYARSLHAQELAWLQDCLAAVGFSPLPFAIEEGTANGCIQFHLDPTGRVDWQIIEGSLKNVRLSKDQFRVSCDEIFVKDGMYSFFGGAFALNRHVVGANWEGKGDLSSRKSSIEGTLGKQCIQANLEGGIDSILAHITLKGEIEGSLSLETKWESPNLLFVLRQAFGTFFSLFSIEAFQMKGEINRDGLSCFDARGVLDIGKKIPFYCPIFQSEGRFDFRFEHPLFDLARFAGTLQGGEITVDEKRSHILGEAVYEARAFISEDGLDQTLVRCKIPWKLFPFFLEIPKALEFLDAEDLFTCQLSCGKKKGLELELSSALSSMHLRLSRFDALWRLEPSTFQNCVVQGSFRQEKEGFQIIQGKGVWKEGAAFDFTGRVFSFDWWDLTVSRLRIDLSTISQCKEWGVEGILEGEGILHWKGGLESDFDLIASHLKFKDWAFENGSPIHAYCSSKKGISVRGMNLSVIDSNANCKIGLFQYDLDQSLFVLTQSQFHFSPDFIAKLGLQERFSFFPLQIGEEPLHGIADLAFSSDLSNVSLFMKELEIPLDDTKYHVQNLHLDIDQKECKINFDLDHQSRLIPMDLAFGIDPLVQGRLTIENNLKIDWTYQDRLCLQTIVGMCTGIDASFYLEGDSMIGSARVNGNELKELLPEKIARVFHELKIGDGYELKGRLSFSDQGLGFKGILSGKQIELFDFEFRNILAQIEWDANHLHISDLKVSDFAGVLKIDHILAKGVGKDPWTISIPHITITELRPSLLQDVGGPPGKLSPLVVRELKIDDFQGLVDDGNTYTAHGELYFINSYKRGKSILELPSDWLSRIVGLDFDLMIPVCGTLRYELHDGFFHFTELVGSFSENKRSEFFLVFNENSPKMDLDWNLNILIQMKQFVLFKFTEAFIISVTGKLDDPKIQLQRKNRFLGAL